MKITAKNLVEKWDEIKDKMPDYVTVPSAAYLEFADIYDDLDEDTISKFDAWLADVNEALAKSPKSSRKYVRGDGKLRRKKPQTKPESEPKADKKPKAEKKPKSDKQPKQEKEQKPSKTKFGEKPYWYTILETYVKTFEGQADKQQWRVRAFVKSINTSCNANLKHTTPHIDLIRQIRNGLLDLANSNGVKTVDIPANEKLRKACEEAIAKYTISRKEDKPKVEQETLSGVKKKSRVKRNRNKKARK